MEKESLERRQQLALEEMKLAMEEAQQKELSELEQEKEQFLRELRERLDREKRKVRSVLPGSAEVWGLNHTCSALVARKARRGDASWAVGRRTPPAVITIVIH